MVILLFMYIFTKKYFKKYNLLLNLVIVFYALGEYNSIYKITRKKCINLGGRLL